MASKAVIGLALRAEPSFHGSSGGVGGGGGGGEQRLTQITGETRGVALFGVSGYNHRMFPRRTTQWFECAGSHRQDRGLWSKDGAAHRSGRKRG